MGEAKRRADAEAAEAEAQAKIVADAQAAMTALLGDYQEMIAGSDQGRVRTAILAVESIPDLTVFDLGMVAGAILAAAADKLTDEQTGRFAQVVMLHAGTVRQRKRELEAKAPAPDATVIRASGNEWMDEAPKPADELAEEIKPAPLGILEGDAMVVRQT